MSSTDGPFHGIDQTTVHTGPTKRHLMEPA